jgi:hypothetical protein
VSGADIDGERLEQELKRNALDARRVSLDATREEQQEMKWPIATPSFSLCSKASLNPRMQVSPRKFCRNFC